ncbi:MAG TPA: NAD(+)/NADH kinase [Acidimicrobiales bacterium]|nr:NAD(+)/NADH kinase [Acidimicrobiales bacterium]
MANIGFVAHAQREGALALANETVEWLRAQGHTASVIGGVGDAGPGPVAPADAADTGGSAAGLDLAVSLGGDGTMLRTVDLVSQQGVPVLGVNLGHLGYLTAVEPDELRDSLKRFLAGDYQVEARMTLDVSVSDGEASALSVLHRSALNDLVLQRAAGGHTVNAEVAVNGSPFLTFAADSIILATPTGSTAYNLSARGPIVSPRARVQILTPVAPHMLFDRSLILDEEDEVSVKLRGDHPADLVVDGWKAATLRPGQTLHSRRGDRDALLVRFAERDFHDILKRKFNLGGPNLSS